MRCPVCAGAELISDTRDVPHAYRGQTTVIRAVTAEFCPECGKAVMDAAESRRVSKLMLEFHKKVNGVSGDPEFIFSVRKKLGLSQREAAAIFGGGVNAFSQYETSKKRPPLALVKLLKVLEKHPDLLDEVRAA